MKYIIGSDTDDVVIELFADGEEEAVHSVTVNGNSTEYSFEDVETGTYIMVVSKNNHVAREYTLTVVDESLVQDAKIHLEGDVNGDGKVNTMDVARANAHARGVASVTGYEFDCLDVNGDGKINTVDVARVNAHARGVSSLW